MDNDLTVHIDYIFMTMKIDGQRVRFVVGNQKNMPSIVYTYDLDMELDDRFYSHCVYLNALTEEQGRVVENLIESKQTRKAHNYLLKNMNQEDMLGPCGPVEMSDLVPDEWFDGCKDVLMMIKYPKCKGVFPMDFVIED